MAGVPPQNLSRVAGGKPVSANPDIETLRPVLDTRAGPASPERLLVYPMRDEVILGTG